MQAQAQAVAAADEVESRVNAAEQAEEARDAAEVTLG